MRAETPERLVLEGPFEGRDAEKLSTYCAQLRRAGQSRVLLDVHRVTRCDSAGLACWRALTETVHGLSVHIEGVRWSQFLDLLRSTGVDELANVGLEIRLLVAASNASSSDSQEPS